MAGRDKLHVSQDEIKILAEAGCSKIAMARTLGISVSTIKRRLREMNIKLQKFSDISNQELTRRITCIHENFPQSGYREVNAHLKCGSCGVPVTYVARDRVAKILCQVDPQGTQDRWARAIRRRAYSVPTPNTLWHIDSHHKLIRWNIVVIGAIDGYSRLIPYLGVSGDNLASTSFKYFLTGVNSFGIPRRCRADDGGENVLIRRFMQCIFENNDSFITGSSVHNERIERLWRDVYEKVLSFFVDIFYSLENMQLLDRDCDKHIYALHFVFLPVIQQKLTQWSNAHNNHPLRTENNRTPKQLWLSGILQHREEYIATGMAMSLEVSSAVSDFSKEAERYFGGETAADEESTIHIHTRKMSYCPSDNVMILLDQALLSCPALPNASALQLAKLYRKVFNIILNDDSV